MSKKIYDVGIIGAGPIGMFAAYYASMREQSVVLIDSLPNLGGQLSTSYPQKTIKDAPGFAKIKAETLIKNLENQLSQFNPKIFLNCKITEVIRKINPDEIQLKSENGELIIVKKLIIATGIGSFAPKKLNAEYDPALENVNIHYGVANPKMFANKRIGIVGGGDTALDWAVDLSPISKSINIIHRRDKFRALESTISTAKSKNNISFSTPFTISDVKETADHELLTKLTRAKTGEETSLSLDHLIVNFGYKADTTFIKDWGISLNSNNLISVSRDMQTNLPGIYAIGDAVGYEGRPPLIATGFGEAPIAVNAIIHELNPDDHEPIPHSTNI